MTKKLDELVARTERLSPQELLLGAAMLLDQNLPDLAAIFAQKAIDKLHLAKLLAQ